jgi:hypothetical protein
VPGLDLGSPEGIALDHLGRNIFWTDSHLDRIEVAKLDGTQRRVLFETDLVNPRGIVTDSVRGYFCVNTCVHLLCLRLVLLALSDARFEVQLALLLRPISTG